MQRAAWGRAGRDIVALLGDGRTLALLPPRADGPTVTRPRELTLAELERFELGTSPGLARLAEYEQALMQAAAGTGDVPFPDELDPQIGFGYRSLLTEATHTFLIGLGNDELGYQVPFAKWDNSCHACAWYDIYGVIGTCPEYPPDCDTIFANSVGQQIDPDISGAISPVLTDLNTNEW